MRLYVMKRYSVHLMKNSSTIPVFYGKDADEVIANYRNLSGKVPMLPLWDYGFCEMQWVCIRRTIGGNCEKRSGKRKLPLDVIVQDWQYWGKHGWGVPKFGGGPIIPTRKKFILVLHDLHARFSFPFGKAR